MNSTIVDLITIAGIVITILLALGAALVIFRGAYAKARIDALVRDVEIYQNRESLHDREMTDCRERITVLETKVGHLTEENAVLVETATQKAEVGRLTTLMREQHEDMMAMFEQMLIAIGKLGPDE